MIMNTVVVNDGGRRRGWSKFSIERNKFNEQMNALLKQQLDLLKEEYKSQANFKLPTNKQGESAKTEVNTDELTKQIIDLDKMYQEIQEEMANIEKVTNASEVKFP